MSFGYCDCETEVIVQTPEYYSGDCMFVGTTGSIPICFALQPYIFVNCASVPTGKGCVVAPSIPGDYSLNGVPGVYCCERYQ